jgi:hypothetical protein
VESVNVTAAKLNTDEQWSRYFDLSHPYNIGTNETAAYNHAGPHIDRTE